MTYLRGRGQQEYLPLLRKLFIFYYCLRENIAIALNTVSRYVGLHLLLNIIMPVRAQ